MPSRIKRLFDLSGELGRWSYFKSSIYRNLLAFLVLVLIAIFDLIFDAPNYKGADDYRYAFTLMSESQLYTAAAFALEVPA